MLLALALHGGVTAGLVGMAGILGAAAGRKPLPAPKRLAFNLAVSVLSTTAAAWVAHQLGGRSGLRPAAWTWPLAAAIALEKRQGYLATWNRSLRWTALPYLAGFTVAVAALSVCQVSYAAGIALTIAPCWCLVLVYRAEALPFPARRLMSEATSRPIRPPKSLFPWSSSRSNPYTHPGQGRTGSAERSFARRWSATTVTSEM